MLGQGVISHARAAMSGLPRPPADRGSGRMTDERLVGCLSRLPKVPDGAGILVLCLLGWFEIGFEGAFNPNASATGWAGKQRITLEPSDRLREFVAALRAFDVDGTTIKEG